MAEMSATERFIWQQTATINELRARLAEVEAQRDAYARSYGNACRGEAEAQARLAAVEKAARDFHDAVTDYMLGLVDGGHISRVQTPLTVLLGGEADRG